jgi:8-oxo-dGTP pyrophosphatase MutT (NUDIX family)
MLLRDGPAGIEVLMVRRHLKSDFVGGAYVFPGGAVDDDDSYSGSCCAGLNDRLASMALGIDEGGLAYWVAAIRECFEETGILLAWDASGTIPDFTDPWLMEQRRRLQEKEVHFADIVRECKLKLATDRVYYWGHWITPEEQTRRYDTRFFLACVPEGQNGIHDGNELTESSWIAPQAAIDRARIGEWVVVLPTLYNLKLLSRFGSVAEAELVARTRRPEPAILPKLIRGETGIKILLPGDAEYASAPPTSAASAEEIAAGSLARVEEVRGE